MEISRKIIPWAKAANIHNKKFNADFKGYYIVTNEERSVLLKHSRRIKLCEEET